MSKKFFDKLSTKCCGFFFAFSHIFRILRIKKFLKNFSLTNRLTSPDLYVKIGVLFLRNSE